MRFVVFAMLVACSGGKGLEKPHKAKRVAPLPDAGPSGGEGDPDDLTDDGVSSGSGSGGEKCPPGYSRSGSSCVPTPTSVRNKCAPDDPLCGPGGSDTGIQVVGAIPKEAIHKTIRGNFTDLRACYEQVLLANPGVEGRVVVKFKVGIDGAVTDVTATGVHPDLETCIVDKVRKLRFPKPDNAGSVEVTYPFVFKAG